MKTKFFKIFIFSLVSFTTFSQEKCIENTTGTFKLAQGSFMNNYEITRTDSTQVDIDKVYNTSTEYEIIWIDECTYKLKKVSGKGLKSLKDYDLKDLVFKVDTFDSNGFRYLLILDKQNILIDTTSLERVK